MKHNILLITSHTDLSNSEQLDLFLLEEQMAVLHDLMVADTQLYPQPYMACSWFNISSAHHGYFKRVTGFIRSNGDKLLTQCCMDHLYSFCIVLLFQIL